MLFNSLEFIVFLPIVYLLYWKVFNKNTKFQNSLLLFVSYFFYAYWDYRFLGLLLISTLIDFVLAQLIEKNKSPKLILISSIIINLSVLCVFKYFNFFIDSFVHGFEYLGWQVNPYTLHIILPIGISFYTFHGLSYIIDVYKKRIPAEKSFINYALFICFFPLLVAGPIERATHLLPQIKLQRNFSYDKSIDALRQILWGFFKKIVVADTCANIVDKIFNNYTHETSSTLVLAAFLFAFQIYGDFSGYSDIALGTARLLGIELVQNFSFPYFSRNIAEFWRRWHISLSSWFKDYIYIPLGGSKGNNFKTSRNIVLIFLLSGFWHGANWTFIAWGLLNALYFIPLYIVKSNRLYIDTVANNTILPSWKEFANMFITFTLVVFAWIFFRSASITDAFIFIQRIFTSSLFSLPNYVNKTAVVAIFILIFIEWIGRKNKHALEFFALKWHSIFRISFYYFILGFVIYCSGNEHPFIYFQF